VSRGTKQRVVVDDEIKQRMKEALAAAITALFYYSEKKREEIKRRGKSSISVWPIEHAVNDLEFLLRELAPGDEYARIFADAYKLYEQAGRVCIDVEREADAEPAGQEV
jgi:hypothetical protein